MNKWVRCQAAFGVPAKVGASGSEALQYWGSGYDWRKAEAKLNAFPQFMTTIDGIDIHFIHVRSRRKNALPMIITHGWPGSVFEQIKLIGPVTDPTAFGGRAEDAFDVSFIPARTIHAARNVGSLKGAELATYVVEKGKPLVVVRQVIATEPKQKGMRGKAMKRIWTRVALLNGGTVAMTQTQMETRSEAAVGGTPAASGGK